MSGRSCSLAWTVFFPDDVVGVEDARQRADAEAVFAFRELHLKLLQCDVAGLFDKREDQALVRINARRPAVAAALIRGRAAGLLLPLIPADRARRRDAETLRRLSARHAARHCGHHAFPKIE
jgi:hypothetical protein